jgi:glutathione S-transferase
MELYQAEWCPHSHKVRQRLTELALDFTARQVPADKDERDEMRAAVGDDEIPLLVDGGRVLKGEEEILPYLDERYHESRDAGRHRAKAREEVPDFEEAKRAATAA